MTFPGKFTDQLIADKLDRVSLSFLVDELAIRRGGVAANIAFGLGVLGLQPLLVGAVGADFEGYRHRLAEAGEIKIARLPAEHGAELVLIGAGDPGAMVVHARECREAGLKFAADPS